MASLALTHDAGDGFIVGRPDADPAHAAMAAGFAASRGLSGVEIITGDARCTGLPPGSFDLVRRPGWKHCGPRWVASRGLGPCAVAQLPGGVAWYLRYVIGGSLSFRRLWNRGRGLTGRVTW